MRLDTAVYFQRVTQGVYDVSTGNYAEPTITETMRWASVTDAGDEMLVRLFGKVRQGCKVIRLQNHYEGNFDSIRIGDKVYIIDRVKTFRRLQVFVASEVQ